MRIASAGAYFMEFQQSPLYGKYIRALGWNVDRVDGAQVFYKKIPFLGSILKIQRPARLPNLSSFLKTHQIRTIAIEPVEKQSIPSYKAWCNTYAPHYHVSQSEFMPTKTIVVDTTASEKELFARLSEAKRRAVRRAQKHGVTVEESTNIKDLIAIKNKSGGFFGFITTVGLDAFWDIYAPQYSSILLAKKQGKIVGGVLLVNWNKTAYYWIAGATKYGKQLFAPTLLVWESLLLAKSRGAKRFDFVGVWDERLPKEHTDWKGFTRFKEGFGGVPLYYPILAAADKL